MTSPMTKRLPIHTAPVDGSEIIVGDAPPAWEHRVRWKQNGWVAVGTQWKFAERPTYWRPCDPPAPEPTSPFSEFEPAIPTADTVGEHTPGPWEIKRPRNDERGAISAKIFQGGELTCVAIIPNNLIPEWEANARLIASAPSLSAELASLTAELEKARAALREIASKGHYPDEGIARRALASAEQKP